MEALPLYGWSCTLDFHNAFVALAREHDVPLVPFFMASVVSRDELLLGDRVHPNAAGARIIADSIWPNSRLRPGPRRPEQSGPGAHPGFPSM